MTQRDSEYDLSCIDPFLVKGYGARGSARVAYDIPDIDPMG